MVALDPLCCNELRRVPTSWMISTPNFPSIFRKNSARAVYSKVISSLFPESAHPEIAANRPLAAPQTEELTMSKSTNMLNRLGNLWARVLGSKLRRRSARPVETLESRVLLATLVSANKLTYQDADGDDVEVAFSKPILTPANVNTIFTFNSGTVNGSNATKQQLLKINLVGAPGARGRRLSRRPSAAQPMAEMGLRRLVRSTRPESTSAQ